MAPTALFSVTAAMIRRIVDTTMPDVDIEEIAALKEKWVAKRTNIKTTPSDSFDLGNLQEMVILETASEIKDKDPYSKADGAYREDHYPQLTWSMKLKQLYAMYPARGKGYVKSTDYKTDDIKDTWPEE